MNTSNEYDKYWQAGREFVPKWPLKKVQEIFEPVINKSNLLDYGCGKISRKYGDDLSKLVKKYIGADISDYICGVNSQEGFDVVNINPANSKIDLPDEYFDSAICIEVFEHLYDPLAAAKEICRLLEKNGVFVATVPNYGYFSWRLLALLRARVPHEPESSDNPFKGVHIRFFNISSLRKLLEMAGFEIIYIKSYDPSSIWDVFRVIPPWSLNRWARENLPPFFHLQFLEKIWPGLFGQRLIISARKL